MKVNTTQVLAICRIIEAGGYSAWEWRRGGGQILAAPPSRSLHLTLNDTGRVCKADKGNKQRNIS